MNNNIRILLLLLFTVGWLLPVGAQQPIMGGEASVTDLEVVHEGQQLHVSMSLDVTNLTVGGDETVILTPVLTRDGRVAELPAVEIMGRRAYLHYLRGGENPVSGHAAYAERTARRSERRAGAQIIAYETTLPYEDWMSGALVSVREGSCGCSNTPLALGESPLERVLEPAYEPHYLLTFVEPDPEPVKIREESFSAYVNFRIDRWAILEDYKNNASELAAIRGSFERVKDDRDLTVASVEIDGWASPEGTEAHNRQLSQRRADALADYIASACGIDRASVGATGHGEDWAGLRAGVEVLTGLLDQHKVLAVIDDTELSFDARESKLKKLIPPTIYQRLYNEIYPSLRRNDYRIVYRVRNFDIEEAKALLETAPQKLSLGEMYRIAGLYEKDSEAYDHVLEVAARTYPTQPAAAVNHALRLLERGEYDAAVALLRQSDTSDPRVLNALGVAYVRGGDTEAAREAWEQAAKGGSADAEHNLGELSRTL